MTYFEQMWQTLFGVNINPVEERIMVGVVCSFLWAPPGLADDVSVRIFPGLSVEQRARLEALGYRSSTQLRHQLGAMSTSQIRAIAEYANIPMPLMDKTLEQADLMGQAGVDAATAALLVVCGVPGRDALAQENADDLPACLTGSVQTNADPSPDLPTRHELSAWIVGCLGIGLVLISHEHCTPVSGADPHAGHNH